MWPGSKTPITHFDDYLRHQQQVINGKMDRNFRISVQTHFACDAIVCAFNNISFPIVSLSLSLIAVCVNMSSDAFLGWQNHEPILKLFDSIELQ